MFKFVASLFVSRLVSLQDRLVETETRLIKQVEFSNLKTLITDFERSFEHFLAEYTETSESARIKFFRGMAVLKLVQLAYIKINREIIPSLDANEKPKPQKLYFYAKAYEEAVELKKFLRKYHPFVSLSCSAYDIEKQRKLLESYFLTSFEFLSKDYLDRLRSDRCYEDVALPIRRQDIDLFETLFAKQHPKTSFPEAYHAAVLLYFVRATYFEGAKEWQGLLVEAETAKKELGVAWKEIIPDLVHEYILEKIFS